MPANRGQVSTLAGKAGDASYFDGPGPAARFNGPAGVAVDAAGTVYVCDSQNQAIRKITRAGVVSSLAGASDNQAGAPGRIGRTDGVGAAASFHNPTAVAVDATGTLYVADSYNNSIRKITAAGGGDDPGGYGPLQGQRRWHRHGGAFQPPHWCGRGCGGHCVRGRLLQPHHPQDYARRGSEHPGGFGR
ncbi:hypothetical protein Q5H93_03670 [Hymenobacter sp. ASUV-10]|uniref:SMP-30/Gluconolactonase/LRE-like region domain-containing protein n=1 Tax=Hymenobacter aranciens TaxID=3063996 RepID=A0ABT9B836_9BACT|nr:hypothetical protein [Hymenobacter sp. ASUV-10]